nr:MAG TPA: hypothetical protein [Caudoviricetes sp.]
MQYKPPFSIALSESSRSNIHSLQNPDSTSPFTSFCPYKLGRF